MSIVTQYQSCTGKRELLKWVGFPASNYYYKPSHKRKGIRPCTTTTKKDGSIVSNTEVVDKIKEIVSGEFVCCGYQNVAASLKRLGYKIHPGKRESRNCYMLSLMDFYSRRILEHIFKGSIRKIDVKKLIARIDFTHGLKGVTVRNDNGSQFIAGKVRHYQRTLGANQEFTHIATPEENSYIEAFHSILEREVIQRFEFESYYEARLTLEAYVNHYNNNRLHGSLKRKTPMQVWNEYYGSLSTDKPRSAQVLEDLSGVSDSADTGFALDKSEDMAYFADKLIYENKDYIKQEILKLLINLSNLWKVKTKKSTEIF